MVNAARFTVIRNVDGPAETMRSSFTCEKYLAEYPKETHRPGSNKYQFDAHAAHHRERHGGSKRLQTPTRQRGTQSRWLNVRVPHFHRDLLR
jgi:hypothetical protein